ncbi:centromere protein V [Callorhinchus milii]|uniref:Centromere protein V like 3 n=1 Tax=Callorhinchus milii TaxID=7868 RepID=A0A4W3IN32_CALMI|nr:centromere protein V [Callorhinchus milii]|eukprot:gi/632957763/ref/XP_007894663.1/ PREDICTED: centromere protein V isoform X2 [Callorhinchus milii]
MGKFGAARRGSLQRKGRSAAKEQVTRRKEQKPELEGLAGGQGAERGLEKELQPPDTAVELANQAERWRAFQKSQRLDTAEAAARLLLDTFEYRDLVKHTGGCHCGAVRFEVWASADLHVFDCNCSICTRKQNQHFIVPASHFRLLKGTDNLTVYTFNTKTAKHTFCKTCGVQSFYSPRSNPDGYGVMPHCLDDGTVHSINVEKINGKEWEKTIKEHKTIKNMSKAMI